MEKFMLVWCSTLLFNQVVSNPTFLAVFDDLIPLKDNVIHEKESISHLIDDGVYRVDGDDLFDFGDGNNYDYHTRETERFLDALELNAKINSGDMMSEYYSGKPQLKSGVEFASEYSTDDMIPAPGLGPKSYHFQQTQNYINYLQDLERENKEKQEEAVNSNVVISDFDATVTFSRFKRSFPAVNHIKKILNDVTKDKLRHDSKKNSRNGFFPNGMSNKFGQLKNPLLPEKLNQNQKQSFAVKKITKLLDNISTSGLQKLDKHSKQSAAMDKLFKIREEVDTKLRESTNKRSKRSPSVDKVLKLADDVSFKLMESSSKRSKRSASVDKIVNLIDSANLKLRDNNNRRSKRSASVDKIVKIVEDVNSKLQEIGIKRSKRSASIDKIVRMVDNTNLKLRESKNTRSKRSTSLHKIAKLLDDVNLKLQENTNKRTKRSASVDKVLKLVDDVSLQLQDNSYKRSKRSTSVDKIVKLVSEANLKLQGNAKRSKRFASYVDKVVKLVTDAGHGSLNQKLTKGVIIKNKADCGGMGRRGGGDEDGEGSGSGDGPNADPDVEETSSNLRLTNMKRFDKRKQKKAVI